MATATTARRRSSRNAARRSSTAQKDDENAQPLSQTNHNKSKKNKEDHVTKKDADIPSVNVEAVVEIATISNNEKIEEDKVKQVIDQARHILSDLGPQFSETLKGKPAASAFDIAPESLSLHTLRDEFLSKSDRSSQRLLLGDNPSPRKKRRSSLSYMMGEGELDIDWALYKEWPEGLTEEERLLLDYFKKLKFIYLEQETKMRLLVDVQDDIENGKEATVYSAGEVAQRESQAKDLKSQLAQAKSVVRTLRKQVDDTADQLSQPWQDVEQDSQEAERLIKEIGDMELELAKIRAQNRGNGANVAAIAKSEGPLTTAEAEEMCDKQIQEMTGLEDETASAFKQIEASKGDLISSHRALDRLNAERRTAENYAKEATRDGGRDLETERMCALRSSNLTLLRTLLGIDEVEAVDENEIRIVYRLPNDEETADTQLESVIVHLQFHQVGGRIDQVRLSRPDGTEIQLPETSAARVKAFKKANDVALLVQEVLAAF